jgi:methylthioribose-1-phosphate isomerase
MPKPTVDWTGGTDGHVRIIDQTRLPLEYAVIDVRTPEDMFDALRTLKVRGAPAIGVAAAYGLVLAVGAKEFAGETAFLAALDEAARYLKSARPTAVNLSWAIDRAAAACRAAGGRGVPALNAALLSEARRIHEEDRDVCRRIGAVGQEIMPDGARVLTHCNAGALATADYGTALAVVYRARELGKAVSVYAGETRPLLQGSRLTAWELMDEGVDVTVICDNMAASLMGAGKIDLVITGADRIAANGDAANKIGTLGLAILARHFRIPFYIAAPVSTFDLSISSGKGIPIEERSPLEVTEGFGKRTAPVGVKAYNPAFDVTPARLITTIVTERGLIRKPSRKTVAAVLGARP